MAVPVGKFSAAAADAASAEDRDSVVGTKVLANQRAYSATLTTNASTVLRKRRWAHQDKMADTHEFFCQAARPTKAAPTEIVDAAS
jgi:hypothetical protein